MARLPKILKGKSREEIKRIMAEAIKKRDELIALDPFWYFKPTTGELSGEMKQFLSQYLKPDDIPQKVDGQLDVLLSSSSIIGASGGNQAGKSCLGAIKGFIKSTGELPQSLKQYELHFKGDIDRARSKFVRGRVVGVDFKQMSNTVLPTWREWCPREYLKNSKWRDSFSSQHNVLTLYRNNKPCASVEFMTNQQDTESFQGPPLDWLLYDEEPRGDIHKENMMRFTTAERLDITFCWTPTKGLSWATDLFSEGVWEGKSVSSNIELFKLCSVTNPKANMDVLKEILNSITDYSELKMRLLGEFISLSGLVYGNLFNHQIHVIEPFPITYKDYVVYRGIDPHLVKPTWCVEMAVDREENEYAVGCYSRDGDTTDIKRDLAQRAIERKYRLGWTVCDKSADSTIHVLGDRNIFRELKVGVAFIPALFTSEKYEGSIKAGVDQIKQLLKLRDIKVNGKIIQKPKFFIFNIPENRPLIQAFRTLERDTYANEDKMGMKDRIAEGRHDSHACLRYIHQRPVRFIPMVEVQPQPYQEEVYV